MKQLCKNSTVWFHIPQVSAKPVLDNVSLQIGNKDCIFFFNYFYLKYWHWWFSLSVLIFPSFLLLVVDTGQRNWLGSHVSACIFFFFCCLSFFVPLGILTFLDLTLHLLTSLSPTSSSSCKYSALSFFCPLFPDSKTVQEMKSPSLHTRRGSPFCCQLNVLAEE